jgi:AraC-like DNA-binding protein
LLTLVEFFYYFVVSTLVGVFGLHLVFKKGLLASKFLGLYFIVFCFRIITAYFATDGRLLQYPHFLYSQSPIHFLSTQVGFLFVYFMLYPNRKFMWWQAALFIPFVLHTAELMPFYFGPVENKIREAEQIMKYKSLIRFPSQVTFFSPPNLVIVKVAFNLICVTSAFGMVNLFIRNNRLRLSKNRFVLNWLLSYSTLSLLSMVFVISYAIGWIGFNNLRFSYADLLMHLAAFLNLGFVLYRPGLLDGVSFKSLVMRLHADERISEADEDAEKLKKYEGYAARLEELFAREKVFLDASLTLESVAHKIQISTKSLSRTTSYMYKLSFPDFVNTWRINYILEKRRADDAWRNYSQDLLAEQSGFGSRQGLNNAINRLHGMTPAAYFASKA